MSSHKISNGTDEDNGTTSAITTLSGVEYLDEYSSPADNFSTSDMSLEELWLKLTDNLQSDLAVEERKLCSEFSSFYPQATFISQ